MTSTNRHRKFINLEDFEAEDITFAATLKSKTIKLFVSIIRAMSFVGTTELQLSINGVKYVTEESKSFQATAFIKKEYFSTFHIRPPDKIDVISFGVNLNSFTELLSAFLDNELSTMNIVHYNNRNCIVFTFAQTDSGDITSNRLKQQNTIDGDINDEEEEAPAGEIVTEYFIQTLQSIEPIDFTVESPQLLNSVILNAVDFYGVLNDFDRSIDGLEININEKRIKMKSVGILQSVAIAKFQFDSNIFSKYESHKPSKFVYNFKFFKHMLKSIALSSKMSLQTHIDGMIRIQLMMKTDDDQDCAAYMEYFIVPTISDDSDNDD